MSKWMRRVSVSLGAGAVLVGLNMAAGFAAAPLSNVTADSAGAQATAAGIPGLVTLGESDASTSPDGPKASWSAATVAGVEVIGGDDTNAWTGAAGGAGTTVDALNAALCPSGRFAGTLLTCVALFPHSAYTDEDHASSYGSVAEVDAVAFTPDATYGGGVAVLPSSAGATGFCGGSSGGDASLVDYFIVGAGSLGSVGAAHAEHDANC